VQDEHTALVAVAESRDKRKAAG